MFCSECGTQVPNEAEFCHNCGARVEVEPQPAQPPETAPRTSSGAASARVRPAPTSRPVARRAAVTSALQPGGRYVGVSLVVTTLLILGWLIFFLGVVGGAASANQCKEILDEDCSTGDQLGLFFGTVLASWFIAVFFLWSGYVLRLLSDMEARLRSGTPVAPPTDVGPE
jgi:hypothetical protein